MMTMIAPAAAYSEFHFAALSCIHAVLSTFRSKTLLGTRTATSVYRKLPWLQQHDVLIETACETKRNR